MVNREFQKVGLFVFDTLDKYGQEFTTPSNQFESAMIIHEYKNESTNDIRFQKATFVGLTKDSIDDNYGIIDENNRIYKVVYVIPGKRFNQVFMYEY